MPMNRIQFQPGLSLSAFLGDCGDEAQCEAAVVRARGPSGFVCARCQCTGFVPPTLVADSGSARIVATKAPRLWAR